MTSTRKVVRPHFPGAPGWEEVADFAFDRANSTHG
jgi:hypothetical protein